MSPIPSPHRPTSLLPPFRSRGILPLLFLLLLPSLLLADETPEVFGELVDVRVVNLEVVVEDRGDRVVGLDSEDFILTVDGREVPVEYFTEVRDRYTLSDAAPGNVTLPALPPGEPLGTNYLVFVDDVFTLPNQRNRVLRRLAEELPMLRDGDRMAIVAYDGHGVDLLTSWTGSARELERALDEARERPTQGLMMRHRQRSYDDEDFFYRSQFGLASFPGVRGPAYLGGRPINEINDVVTAASATVRAFAQPPGRKVMLVVSGGWAASIWDDSHFTTDVDYSMDRRPQDRLAPLIDTANRVGYTLYPIDAQWNRDAQYGDASIASLREARYREYIGREREWANETSLANLAHETGGKALLGGAGTSVLERVEDDTRSFYWLGFSPDWKGDDRRHKVKVEVKGPRRWKVRSRKSFSDLSTATVTSMRMEGAQLLDLPLPSHGLLAVSAGSPTAGGWNRSLLPIRVEFSLDQVTLVPTNGHWAGLVELRVAATDDRGDHADIPVVPIPIRRASSPQPGETETYELRLKLRDRPHALLFSLVDPASGTLLSQAIDVNL